MDGALLRRLLGSWGPRDEEEAAEVMEREPVADEAAAGMEREWRRLRSFRRWRGAVCPRRLARAGFYFVGPGDRVRCFCCGGVLRDWEPGDRPAAEHRRFFPTCPYILAREAGHLPRGRDSVDGQILAQLQRLPAEEDDEEPEDASAELLEDWHAVYPQLSEERQRLATYRTWPLSSGVTPEQLARAGFFYTGQGDDIRCFHCDGSLTNWVVSDDPWTEHARWFPRCEFVIQSMGPAFIRSVQDSLSSHETTPESPRVSEGSPGSTGDSPSGWQGFLQSSIVQGALQMGFEEMLVVSLVQSRFLLLGTPYSCMSELVNDLVEEEERSAPPSPEPDPIPEAPFQRSATQPQIPKDSVPLSTEEQLRRLKEERMCKVCMDKDVSMVFVPCGHLVVCTDCAPNLRHCPICRATIRGSVRAFMS